MTRIEVKVSLTAEERDHIDAQAKALSMPRSTLMRLRALGDPTAGVRHELPPFSRQQYQRAVTAALKASQGSCSRTAVEAMAAAVLCSIHETPDKPASTRHASSIG